MMMIPFPVNFSCFLISTVYIRPKQYKRKQSYRFTTKNPSRSLKTRMRLAKEDSTNDMTSLKVRSFQYLRAENPKIQQLWPQTITTNIKKTNFIYLAKKTNNKLS